MLPRSSELKEDLEILNNVVRRLPRMAEMMLRSKIKTSRDDFLLDFLQMISAIHQSLQVPGFLKLIIHTCSEGISSL